MVGEIEPRGPKPLALTSNKHGTLEFHSQSISSIRTPSGLTSKMVFIVDSFYFKSAEVIFNAWVVKPLKHTKTMGLFTRTGPRVRADYILTSSETDFGISSIHLEMGAV